jgi:hypothetical protein
MPYDIPVILRFNPNVKIIIGFSKYRLNETKHPKLYIPVWMTYGNSNV